MMLATRPDQVVFQLTERPRCGGTSSDGDNGIIDLSAVLFTDIRVVLLSGAFTGGAAVTVLTPAFRGAVTLLSASRGGEGSSGPDHLTAHFPVTRWEPHPGDPVADQGG